MRTGDISVVQADGHLWLVRDKRAHFTMRSFQVRAHAVAFGRALAFARGSNLYIFGADGLGLIQSRESLTYPFTLD
jgi:hypothetical protein